ncbi:MAG: hypothetical protein JW828_08515 [Sedimentisphaerales bacterium]|nr:hypothetical protein [Sedimentisphaerales bacterium]
MNKATLQPVVIVVLRIIGVLTIFFGLLMVVHMLFAQAAVKSAGTDMPMGMNINIKSPMNTIGGWGIAAYFMTSLFGLILCGFSRGLAYLITPSEDVSNNTDQG